MPRLPANAAPILSFALAPLSVALLATMATGVSAREIAPPKPPSPPLSTPAPMVFPGDASHRG